MRNIHVINLHYGSHENAAYVGNSSVLSNPYIVDKGNIIQKYRWWLWEKICQEDKKVLDILRKMCYHYINDGEIILACWCNKPCHATVIASCLDWLLDYHEGKPVKRLDIARKVLCLN